MFFIFPFDTCQHKVWMLIQPGLLSRDPIAHHNSSMFKLLVTFVLVVLAISNVSAAEIRFNEALLNQTDCSLNTCSFEWNDKKSWIGGIVPGK